LIACNVKEGVSEDEGLKKSLEAGAVVELK
jgi:hypothetical protein